nr:MAG TPA: hypothetical protein [Caudoviricetes sp.]
MYLNQALSRKNPLSGVGGIPICYLIGSLSDNSYSFL